VKSYIELEGVERLEQAATCVRDELLIRLLFHLGCRISEALSLKVEDIDFDAWRKRDLSGFRILYLFLDAVYLPLRQGTRGKEGVLCACGILENGKKVLLHLALGSRESYDAWFCFLHDMTARGLKEPLLVTSDKHKGLKKAVREVFPHAFKQPCLAHKMRNILSKLPEKIEKEMKPLITASQKLIIKVGKQALFR